jgi:hypothetical protein
LLTYTLTHNHRLDEAYNTSVRPIITIDVEPVSIFDKFTTCLYQGTLVRPGHPSLSRLTLCHLIVFALQIYAPLLLNTIIDAFVTKLHSDNTVPYGIVSYFETNARMASLRALVIAVVENCCSYREDERDLRSSFLTRHGET